MVIVSEIKPANVAITDSASAVVNDSLMALTNEATAVMVST